MNLILWLIHKENVYRYGYRGEISYSWDLVLPMVSNTSPRPWDVPQQMVGLYLPNYYVILDKSLDFSQPSFQQNGG